MSLLNTVTVAVGIRIVLLYIRQRVLTLIDDLRGQVMTAPPHSTFASLDAEDGSRACIQLNNPFFAVPLGTVVLRLVAELASGALERVVLAVVVGDPVDGLVLVVGLEGPIVEVGTVTR